LRVPASLRDQVGVQEIRRSLGTSCPHAAKAVAADLYARIQQALFDIREKPEDATQIMAAALGTSGAPRVAGVPAKVVLPTIPTVTKFLADSYLAEMRLGEDSRRHIINYVGWFARITGDKPLAAYSRGDVVSYIRTLERLRWTLGKDPRDLEVPVADLLAQSEGMRCMGATTVEKHLTHVRAFFLSALGYHRFAPEADVRGWFAPVPLSDFVPRPGKRSIWQVNVLNRLFASPIWSGTASAPEEFSRRHVPGGSVHRDAYWWLPVLALYTGCRLEELAQLHHEDLKRDKHGLAFLDINSEGVRRLKNSGSARLIPLHSVLTKLGAEKLFASEHSGLVFPELRPHGRMNKLGGLYTVHFTRYRREIGIYDPQVDFHSFRHTFVTRLGEFEVPGLKIARLAGHADADPDERRMRMTRRYSHYDITPLRDAIERLDYPGLVLNT